MSKKFTHPAKGKEFPERWVSGTDPETHKKYLVFIQQRNQAVFRQEGWDLSFEDWCSIWGTKFNERGRKLEQYCSTRIDKDSPWTKDNFIVMLRKDFMTQEAYRRVDKRWAKYERTEEEQAKYLIKREKYQAQKALKEKKEK